MMQLFEALPVDLVQCIWVEWLDLVDVAHLDSALCSRGRRTPLLATMYDQRCLYNYSRSKRSRCFAEFRFIEWVEKRVVWLSSLLLYFDTAYDVPIVRRNGPHLKYIYLALVSAKTCAAVADCCFGLETLHLCGYDSSVRAQYEWAPAIIRRNSHVKHLRVETYVENDTIDAIAECGSVLQSLSIQWEGIRKLEWQKLLGKLPCLTSLSSDAIRDESAVALLASLPLLVSLELSSMSVPKRILQQVANVCPQLQRLALRTCTAGSIIKVLARCRALTAIELEDCHAPDEVLEVLARDFPGMRELKFHVCTMDADSMVPLLANWPKLERLELINAEISDRFLCAIGAHCPNLCSLVYYGRRNDDITDYGCVCLARGCPELRELTLQGPLLTELTVHEIATHCRHIQLVKLTLCESGLSLTMNPMYRKFLTM
jgi:hypothetical protein